ncbi:MAG: DUF3592 domain-containing protein [Bacilli bacterium]|nr:DUF3592 domain-containing protein [Bacilli bacterium]
MICPYCKKENKNTNIRCEFCGTQFNNYTTVNSNDTIELTNINNRKIPTIGCNFPLIMLILFGPFILFALFFIGMGIYSYIEEHSKTIGYEKTIGTLVDYKDCELYDDNSELCNAVYEYEIDGIKYKVSPNLLSNRNGFEKTMTVHYNSDNPKESIIYAGWESLTFSGLIFLVIAIGTIISIIIILRRLSKNKKLQTYN